MYAGLVVYLVFIIRGVEVRVELSGIAGVGSCWEGETWYRNMVALEHDVD